MGWTGEDTFKTKAELVRFLISDFSERYEVLDSQSVGSGLWLALKPDDATAKPFILLILISKKTGGEFLYKDVSEQMGPAQNDCPLRMLKLIPDPQIGYSTQFRASVEAYHAEKKAPKRDLIGLTVQLFQNNPTTYLVLRRVRRSLVVERQDGRLFRLTREQERRAVVVTDLRSLVQSASLRADAE